MWNRGDNPLSHGLRRASSPKGTPLRYAGNLIATAKSRPLGEGGIAVGDDGRGNLRSGALCTSARNSPAMPKAPSQRTTSPAPGEDVTEGDKKGNLAATNGSRLGEFRQIPPQALPRQLPQGDAFALCRKLYATAKSWKMSRSDKRGSVASP